MNSQRLVRMILIAALAALPATVAGQTVVAGASISGRIVDQSGAALAGIRVSATQLETKAAFAAASDETGRFRFLWLPVGRYRLVADLPGFRHAVHEHILSVGDPLDVTLVMRVAVGESVSVRADAAITETTRTATASVVTPAEVASLPLNGRNYLDLALLTPGASRTNTGVSQRFAETSAVPGTGISISSQRNLNNSFVVDGLSANDDAAGLAGTFFSQEVVREFQVISSGGAAEFGRASSGIINVATQSGTNSWRGGGYGFFRDEALDAVNPLTSRKDPLRQWQSGITVSGPAKRDAAFFFANVERTSNDRAGNVTVSPANVPAIETILAGRGYPGPGVSTGSFRTGFTTTNAFARIDRQWAGARRLAVRYSLYDVASDNARGVGGLNTETRGTRLDNRDQTLALSLVVMPRGTLVHELRGHITRSRLLAPPNDFIGPAVSISGVANFGTSTTSPTGRALDVFQVAEAVTWQRGNHVLKAGGDFLFNRVSIEFPGAFQGTYTFASLATFSIGRYGTFQQAFGEPVQKQRNPNLGFFAQDEWRVGSAVTVSAGVRYDLQWLPEPIRTDANNVSPRIGLAFAPGSRRTVIRANAGLFFDRIPLRATSNALQRDGVKYKVAVLSFGQAGAPVFPAVLPAFPADLLVSITSIDPGINAGRGLEIGAEVQHAFAWSTVTVGYQHLDGRGLIMSRNVNVPTLTAAQAAALGVPNLGRPDPRFGNIGRFESIGQSQYDGLSVSIRVPDGARVSGRLSYTVSRAMDDSGNFFFSQPQDASNVHADWGPSDNDQRHRLSLSGSVRGPAEGPGVRRVLGGWSVAGIFSYASALPFNMLAGADLNNDTNNNDRPAGVTRNSARGFDFSSLDVRISRGFRAGGTRQIEVIAEAFNLLNHSNYLVPNNTFGTGSTPLSTFGRATDAAEPRQIQVGVRVVF